MKQFDLQGDRLFLNLHFRKMFRFFVFSNAKFSDVGTVKLPNLEDWNYMGTQGFKEGYFVLPVKNQNCLELASF